MAQVTAQMVNSLRQRTGISMMDCKNALKESDGDEEKAIDILRKKGAIKAAKRAERGASEGCVQSYIHMGGRIGVLLELNCESDFVGKNEDFQEFAREIAMHIAAAAPIAVRREEVPQSLLDKEREIALEQIADKPPQAQEKIIEGKLNKYFSTICLLEQPYVKNPDQTVQDVINDRIQKLGENIVVGRFARYALGE
ncbi:MAG: translation elongation factor Ts [Opitutales bacterium]